VTLAVDPVSPGDTKKNKPVNKQSDVKTIPKKLDVKKDKSKDANINIPMLKLPPGNTKKNNSESVIFLLTKWF
jgi:hypothetical protein